MAAAVLVSVAGTRQLRDLPLALSGDAVPVLLYPDMWYARTSSLALLISLPTTLALAALSYYVIEKPLMGWGKKYA